MAENSRISFSSDLGEVLSRFAGQLGNIPTRAEMTQTRGEATGPLYEYHLSLNGYGQYAAEQAGNFLATVHSMQSWMAEAIADLERTDLEAAETLRKLQADIEGYQQDWRGTTSQVSASGRSATPTVPDGGLKTGWA